MRDDSNTFKEHYAEEAESVLCSRIMEKSTRKSLVAKGCCSSTNQKEEEK